ncbi:MAG: hypothetical protein HKN14_14205, partial [Marinicaulis sp.]|nr:hypothetical protein [Marinicaulis sp.]
MPLEFIFKKMLGALPVLMFLTALVQFDSFKLVRLRLVLMTITAGAFAAVVGAFANTELIAALNMSYLDYSHTIAPWFEEILKALVIIFLIQTSRIG